MKAAQVTQYGGINVLEIKEVKVPTIGESQVLVKVMASSLNPFDTTIREGYMKEMVPLELPFTLGGDIAGEVMEVGANVSHVKAGDAVYGQANVVAGNSGALAEVTATKSSQVAVMPKNVDFKQAASLPLVGTSALQALTEHIKLKAGQKIFIHGGAGGIGSIAIQIAKNIGAYVATTATGENIALVTELGADEVIDYKAKDFSTSLHDYDSVFDTVGGDDFAKSYSILKPGGVAVSMIAAVDEAKATELDITAIRQSTQVTTEALDALRELVESSVVTTRIASVFPLADIQAAFKAREDGGSNGKIVIDIQS